MIETRTQGTDTSPQQLQRFVYSNHLGSASLELDETAHIISYEEYHPYGTTAYQANNADINAVAKRYRYTGKERDEESGLYYHGARYYIPWLARWTAVDPLEAKYAGWSSYQYCTDNPINHTDSTGQGNDDWLKKKGGSAADNTQHAPINHTGSTPTNIVVPATVSLTPAGQQVSDKTKTIAHAHARHNAIANQMLPADPYAGSSFNSSDNTHQTTEQKAHHESVRLEMLNNIGYGADGFPNGMTPLAENKHWQGFAENIVDRTAELAMIVDGGELVLKVGKAASTKTVVEIAFKEGFSKEDIAALPRGGRPSPSEYLKEDYVASHLAQFDGGASYMVPKWILDKYGRAVLGRLDGQFVMTKGAMDELLLKANGDLSIIETELGIPAGDWKGLDLVRIDVSNPRQLDLRIPSGNEEGANQLWIPGGYCLTVILKL